MAAFNWREVRGEQFTPEEAREASDFVEVLRNFGMNPIEGYEFFKSETGMSSAKRLVFAETIDLDNATVLLLCDPDVRIRNVVSKRLEESRLEENGGIILA